MTDFSLFWDSCIFGWTTKIECDKDRWKLWAVVEKENCFINPSDKYSNCFTNPSDKYSKYYRPTEHSVASEIILLFKGSYLQTVCSKGTQIVWDKICKQCDSKTCIIQYDCL